MNLISHLLQPAVGMIKKEFNKNGKLVTVHYHNSVIKGIRSKVEMKSYEVGGTTGRGTKRSASQNKHSFSEKGIFCPKCFRTVKN